MGPVSEWELFFDKLQQPEYLHVLLNPLPVYGTALGSVGLLVALLLRSRPAQLVALVLIVISAASTWLVVRYGHLGYDRVYAMSYGDAQQWLDVHAKRGTNFAYAFYLLAALALAAIGVPSKYPKAAVWVAIATLVLAVLCAGIGGWIAHAGGAVRHKEFREGPPRQAVEPHHEPNEKSAHHKH